MCYEWNILCCPLLCDIFLKLHVFSQEEEDSQVFVCLFFPQQMIVRIKTFLWFHLHSRVTKLHVGDEIVQIRLAEVCHLILLLNLLMLWF